MGLVDNRTEAVSNALREIFNIIDDMERFQKIQDYLLQTDPRFIVEAHQIGRRIPKYIIDFVTVLTRLYDAGYANASEELGKFK